MLSQLFSPVQPQFAIILDVGDRSNEDMDYRILGGETDLRLARQVVKRLTANIQAAYQTQREMRDRQNDLMHRDPDAFADQYERFEAHQRRRIPNDYGVRITYDDVERGARVRVEPIRPLKRRVGGKA